MKILLINASPRKNGATAKLLAEYAKNLSSKGNVEARLIHLADLELQFCRGCCQCSKRGDCILADDADRLSEQIGGADGLIVGTPCYASNVTGQLKTLIDRGHFVFEQLLKGKYAVGVVTYENAEGGAAFKALKKLFVFSGAQTAGKLMVKLPFGADPLEVEGVKAKVGKQSDQLYRAITHKKAAKFTTRAVQFLVFHFGIKPFVLKKGDLYGGVRKHWEKRNVAFKKS